VLKEEFGRDAVAIGWSTAGSELMRTLCAWAQVVVIMQEKFRGRIPKEFASKVIACDVGEDVWVNPRHPELQGLCREFVKKELM
jgi:predicted protein tyrosine phosphatase